MRDNRGPGHRREAGGRSDARAMTMRLPRSRIADIVRALHAFASVPERAGIDLVQNGQLIEYEEEQLLITQADPSDHALILIEGTVEVLVESKYGFVHLATLQSPAFVGEIGVLTNVPRTASIKARTKVLAARLGFDELHRFGQENPAFLSALMHQLGQRYQTFNKAMGFYSHALGALERDDFELTLLDDLTSPLPELVDFSKSFASLAEQITLRRAQREEMANARAIQESMLPDRQALEQCRAYVEVEAAMRPAREVGGDLYDFFLIDSDRLAFTVGDVCGKGIPAALFMAMTQMVMRYMLQQETDVGAAATAANSILAAGNREMMFATLFCSVLHLKTGMLSYCSCGHHSPLILRKDGRVETVTALNPALGLVENAKYGTNSLILEPCDRLLLFTDGFVDALNDEETRFGAERLNELVESLRTLPSRGFIDGLMRAVNDFAGDTPQFDDLTSLLVTVIARKTDHDDAIRQQSVLAITTE
jgi:phosphoserine phosphatase RsbU/P